MAKANSTETKIEYKEHPTETLITKAEQLAAMITIITGTGYDSFNNWADSTKHNFLWACAQHAEVICKLAVEVQEDKYHG